MDLQKLKINKVGIVGSGTMGSQIAALFANYGIPVLLLDVETEKDGVYTSEIAEKAINRLKEIKPSTFNFISEPDRSCEGFIAHELGEVVPNAVSGKKDAMRDDGEKIMPQGVDFGRVVPLLVSALQEAIERIETLESK